MAKKTFMDSMNPAMSFISRESIDRAQAAQAAVEETESAKPQVLSSATHSTKPLSAETKSQRLQLLIQPSLKAKLKERASSQGTSVNDLINGILWDALKGE